MTVRKRTSGGTFHYQFRVDGKYYSGDTGKTNRRDALKVEQDCRNEVKAGRTLDSLYDQQRKHLVGKNPLNLEDAWTKFMEIPRKKKAVGQRLKDNESRWNDWLAWMADHHPEVTHLYDVTKEMAEGYIQYIDTHGRYVKKKFNRDLKKLSNNTKNEYRETCNRVFRYLMERGGLAVNPFGHIPKLEKEAENRESFTPDELKVIGEKSAGVPWLYHLFMVGLCTGMREGDVANLKWESVNLEDGWIERVKMGKTKKVIDVPIMPSLNAYLKELPRVDEIVHPDLLRRYNADAVGKAVTAFLEDECDIVTTRAVPGRSRPAKIKDVHSLRHTFCYMAAINGIPMPVVQGILGHMSPEMTKTYMDHADRETKRDMVKQLPNHLAPELKKMGQPSYMPTRDELIKWLNGLDATNWSDARDAMRNAILGEDKEATA